MKRFELNGTWKLQEGKASIDKNGENPYLSRDGIGQVFDVEIPGSVLSALVDQKVIEDPYYRCNEYETRELFRRDFVFSREFEIGQELLQEELLELVCEGIDTIASIFVNDQLIGTCENMHRTWRFDVKPYVRLGMNEIRIEIASPIVYMESYVPAPGKEIHNIAAGAMAGNQYIRKPHSQFGWDWGAQLPDEGIWRDIYLVGWSQARIKNVKVTQLHPGNNANKAVTLLIDVDLEVSTPGKYKLSSTVTPSWHNGQKLLATTSKTRTVLVSEGQSSLTLEILMDEAKLWWPNGLGDQDLYDISLSLKPAGVLAGGAAALAINKVEPLDTKTLTVGLRTFTVCRDKNEWGEDFSFCINGQKFFAMGANYIPEDCIYSHITKQRQEFLISSAARAHYNTMRVWGGGYYPSDYFYDLCDRYGLVVWQDLMYACNVYDFTDAFRENISAETIDNVRRLRHHASLCLWCGNNEMESAWAGWGWSQQESPYLQADYIKQFEDVLPHIVKKEDSQNFYWPSSPSSGGCFDEPSNGERGDIHYWDVWHGMKPFSDYLNHYFRFCSEFGFQSFPSLKTVEAFTLPEDRNIFSQVMESHQKNTSANTKLLTYLSDNFRYPESFEQVLYTTQILQAEAIKSGVDHWRRNRGRCMGAIYWQMNDDWPVASWSSIDYFNRWKPLHYYAAHFFAPRNGSLVRFGEQRNAQDVQVFSGVQAHFTNESFEKVLVTATLTLKSMDFEVLHEVSATREIGAFEAGQIVEADYEQLLNAELTKGLAHTQKYGPSQVFVEGRFTYRSLDGEEITQIDSTTLEPCKYLEFGSAIVEAEVFEISQKEMDTTNKTETFAEAMKTRETAADAEESRKLGMEVTTEIKSEEVEGYEIRLSANAYTPYVSLELTDCDVIFSDNCIDLTGPEPRSVFLKKSDIINGEILDAKDLQRQLKILTI